MPTSTAFPDGKPSDWYVGPGLVGYVPKKSGCQVAGIAIYASRHPAMPAAATHLVGRATKPKTPDEVRAEFRRAGINLTEWSKTHGFARATVVDVLRGRRQGLRGEAHKVAVALGLKDGDVVDVAKFKQLKKAA